LNDKEGSTLKLRAALLLFIATFFLIFASGCEKDEVSPLVKDEPTKQEVKTEEMVSNESTNPLINESEKKENTPAKKEESPAEDKTNTSTQNNNQQTNTNNKQQPVKKESTPTKKEQKPANEPKEFVTLSIQGVDDNGNKRAIIGPTKIELKSGETFLDATLKVLKAREIPYSVSGSGATAYMEGINNLFEFDHGPTSGWIARKNGVQLKQSTGVEPVKNGDLVEWIYTTDYTKEQP